MEHGQEQRLFLGIDVVGYSKNPDARLALIQSKVKSAVLKAASKAGLDVGSWEVREPGAVQKTGDGLLVAIPDSRVWSAVGTLTPKGVSAELSEFNREQERKVRVRFALHIGPYDEGELGWSTGTPVRLARLLDSRELRAAAARCANADVVVAYSKEVYEYINGGMAQADARKLSEEKKVAGKHPSEDPVYARFLAYYAGAPENIPGPRPRFKVLGLSASAVVLVGLGAVILSLSTGPAAPALDSTGVAGVQNGGLYSMLLTASGIAQQPNQRTLQMTVKDHLDNQTLCVSDTSVEFQVFLGGALGNPVQLKNGSKFPATIDAGQSRARASLIVHTDPGCSMDLLFEDVTSAN